jgi:hypothetical protein
MRKDRPKTHRDRLEMNKSSYHGRLGKALFFGPLISTQLACGDGHQNGRRLHALRSIE